MRILLLILIFITQSICYSQIDTISIKNQINKIEIENNKLNQRIDDILKTSKLMVESNKKTIDSLKNRLDKIENDNKKYSEDNITLKKDFEIEKKYRDKNTEDISTKFATSNIIGAIILLVIIFVLIFSIIYIIRKFKISHKTIEEKALKIDKELIELMSKQMTLLKNVNSQTENFAQKVDHSLAIRVADEINRINMRINKMDTSSRDVQAVMNALKRLESDLKLQGYEIIIKNGEKYLDTMTFLPVNYVPVKGLKPGEQIIHRTIKPQILFDNKVIQHGEIEVGVNENDLV